VRAGRAAARFDLVVRHNRRMCRSIVCACGAAIAVLAIAAGASAKPDKPPKPPKPKVTVLTTSQEGALRREAIKAEVTAKRAKRVRAKARLLVDGYPDDFSFRLGPVLKKLRDREAKVRFGLSPRQVEVLDFAAQTCRAATVAVVAKTSKRTGTKSASLAVPGEC
jgi:hypothetical protein